MSTLRETLLETMADVYDAEKQLLKALPKMAKAAQHDEVRELFETHLQETEGQISRLEEVFQMLGEKARSKKCKGMQGLIKEGEELIKADEGDAALICAAQKIEHYEIAGYGSLASWARLLEEQDAADLLEETLDEEKAADEKLTQAAESAINVEESQEGEEAEEEEEQPKGKGRK